MHDRLHVMRREGELISEEQGSHEGKLLKLLQSDGFLQQLPLWLQREELVDELLGVGQEVVIIIFIPTKFDIYEKYIRKTDWDKFS